MDLTNKSNAKKLRGGFYTPKVLSDHMARWAVRSKDTSILEPSCGDGVMVESAVKRLIELGADQTKISNLVIGVELDSDEAEKAVTSLSRLGVSSARKIIHAREFFEYCKSSLLGKHSFDAVIGNPPFIRYQDFPKEMKQVAFELMKKADLTPIGHTSSWVPFLVVSSLLLNDKGLLAMIVPAQLFLVNYAAETRQFLSDFYKKLTIIAFEKLIFPAALQDVVILLGERSNNDNEGIRVVELKDISELRNLSEISDAFSTYEFKPLDHTRDKWIQYFLNNDEILLLKELKESYDCRSCGEIFEVDIGVVTGRNDYFVLNDTTVKDRDLTPFTDRIIGFSSGLRGIRFSDLDWLDGVKDKLPTYLFKPPDAPLEELPKPVKDYINHGEEIGVNEGYKCKIRNEWYQVPSTWAPDAFMLRHVHRYPKIVLNETTATCTDSLHRVRLLNANDGRKIAAAFMNSMTFGFSEVIGRSYGGGVLILEPSEAEKLPIPIKGAENLDFDKIDSLERQNRIEDILKMTDGILLKQELGLSEKQVNMFHNIWKKLSYRRNNRGRKN